MFVIGLLTGVHCIAMWGGINLTQSVLSAEGKEQLLRSNLLYNLGRVCSYTLIGGIVGAIGGAVSVGGRFSGAALPAAQRSETVRKATPDGDRQIVRSEIGYGSYEAISVQSGVPVEWTIYVPEGRLNGCNGEILVREYDLDIKLHEGENVVTFTPGEAGTVPYSCWMGMIRSNISIT